MRIFERSTAPLSERWPRSWLVPWGAAVILGLLLRVTWAGCHTTFTPDELEYVRQAEGLHPLRPPPLYPLLVRLLALLLPWEVAARAVSIAAATLLSVILPGVGRAMWGSFWPGTLAALAVAVYPPLVDLSARAMTESLYSLLLVLLLWTSQRLSLSASQEAGWRQRGVTGVLWGASLVAVALCRREGLIYLALVGTGALLRVALRGRWQALLVLVGVGLGVLGVLHQTQRHLEHWRDFPRAYWKPQRLRGLFETLWLPWLALGWPMGLRLRRNDGAVLAWFALLLLPGLLLLWFAEPGRKLVPLSPLLFLLAGEGLRRLGPRALGVALPLWLASLLLQGTSPAMRVTAQPPWRDQPQLREAVRWSVFQGQGKLASPLLGADAFGEVALLVRPYELSLWRQRFVAEKLTFLIVKADLAPAHDPEWELVGSFPRRLDATCEGLRRLCQGDSQPDHVMVYRFRPR